MYCTDKCEVFFSKDDNSIRIAPVFYVIVSAKAIVSINEEHREYAWLTIDQALNKLSMPLQKEVVRHVYEYFIINTPPSYLRV
ncbi:NUDIX hydrolase [endosymbiont of Acanthamoeba sp. UWC8]|nr:NUDIX hydrolase [endosymbiont of Acanthamoeba sp. UWC8]